MTEVAEERISVQQWREDAESGALTEVFACGTAAGITPVGEVRTASGSWRAGDTSSPMGPVTTRLRAYLNGIQNGTIPTLAAGCAPSARTARPHSPGPPPTSRPS